MQNQLEAVSLELLVDANHPYRKFIKFLNENDVRNSLQDIQKITTYEGFGVVRLFKCLLLQFIENLSDRELERYLKENLAAKWFCGFSVSDSTPTYSTFCRIRERIGTERLSRLFEKMRDEMKSAGYMSEVFTFVDATHLISKANLWKERDEAIKQGYEKLNNEVLPKMSADNEMRIGCKGKNKFWYGYKQQVSVDMQSGLINKVSIRYANEPDSEGFRNVCPKQGAIYADKGYCVGDAPRHARARGVHLAAIKKRNMKDRKAGLNTWISKIRAPFERVFSKWPKRTRFRGLVKNQFGAFMGAIAFNLKRLLVLSAA